MMDWELALTTLRDVTVSGILTIGIWALLTGKVVTRFHYDEMNRLYEERIERLKNGAAQGD